MSNFESNVDTAYRRLLSFDPFSKYSGKFNVFRIDEDMDLGCEMEEDDCPRCDFDKIWTTIVGYCSLTKYAIVFVDASKFQGGCHGYVLRAGDNALFMVLSSDYPNSIVHEFGHYFGGLADEYITGNTPRSSAPNCDVSNCPKWSSWYSGCYKDCSKSEYYRPSEKCRMNAGKLGVDQFCPVCYEHLDSLLEGYSLRLPTSDKIYNLHLNYDSGILTLKDITFHRAVPIDASPQPTSGYKISETSSQNNVLYTSVFEPPVTIDYDAFEKDTTYPVGGGSYNLREVDFSVAVPYLSNSASINIYNSENTQEMSIGVSKFETKQLAISTTDCRVGKKCSSNVIGNCKEGLWIVLNKEGKPLQIPVIQDIPSSAEFTPANTGKVDVISICFEPKINVQKTTIEVV
jgi:hypothetical protein